MAFNTIVWLVKSYMGGGLVGGNQNVNGTNVAGIYEFVIIDVNSMYIHVKFCLPDLCNEYLRSCLQSCLYKPSFSAIMFCLPARAKLNFRPNNVPHGQIYHTCDQVFPVITCFYSDFKI